MHCPLDDKINRDIEGKALEGEKAIEICVRLGAFLRSK